ncbi:MAG: hypothetical protein JW862_09520 [Anaerolineales bacterium]|nr:hypothetical protein [Anaerolineales bacterium]
MPKLFRDLARSGGHDVNVAMLVQGGWTLNNHLHGNSIETIQRGPWDYVVLQEQSAIPSKTFLRERQMFPAIRKLNMEIEKVGAKTILFMTWGHRDGTAILGIHDYTDMQSKIIEGYDEIGRELAITLSPVGKAWQELLVMNPQIELWQTAGSHPYLSGSYLSACVFYSVVFQDNPEGLPFIGGLPEDEGLRLQQVATRFVFEDDK